MRVACPDTQVCFGRSRQPLGTSQSLHTFDTSLLCCAGLPDRDLRNGAEFTDGSSLLRPLYPDPHNSLCGAGHTDRDQALCGAGHTDGDALLHNTGVTDNHQPLCGPRHAD